MEHNLLQLLGLSSVLVFYGGCRQRSAQTFISNFVALCAALESTCILLLSKLLTLC